MNYKDLNEFLWFTKKWDKWYLIVSNHVSQQYVFIKQKTFSFLKGKGEMRTFWLLGKETSDTESLRRSPPTVPVEPLTFDKKSSFTEYLREGCDGFINRLGAPGTNESCFSLYHSYNRNDSGRVNGYRSAPVISFKEFYSPSDCVLWYSFVLLGEYL